MDQQSTKDGMGGSDRRNWRERLGVGQDLPKISDEFKTSPSDSDPVDDSCQSSASPGAQTSPQPSGHSATPSGALPGKPVARPAPMAPRFTRPAATQAGNGSTTPLEAQTPKHSDKPAESRAVAASPGVRPWAMPSREGHERPENGQQQRPTGRVGEAGRPGPGLPPVSAPSRPLGAERPGEPLRPGPAAGPERQGPIRGPAAYAQGQRPATSRSAGGGDSFGERLRAQREAAERLAQQRLAAARERLATTSADNLTLAGVRKAAPAPQGRGLPQREPHGPAKPKSGDQPRFTFAKEEIVAAQQETGLFADTPPPAAGQQPQSPVVLPKTEPGIEANPAAVPEYEPEHSPDYRHQDEGMFDDEQPGLRAIPPRASAADYSAAYREFEDEFEEETGRRRGPLLLLVSLAAVAVVAGGLIYGYQQMDDSPATPVAVDLPVVTAPEEPAKVEATPVQQPQQAAVPATRKQIYDRIIGEETLEPERIVPTEEEPQLQGIEQPVPQEPRASTIQETESPAAAGQNQSTEPLPLPLPPPPGTGEQGDLLVPGMADTQTASATTEPQEQPELTLPEPASASGPAEASTTRLAAVQPTSGDPSPAYPGPRTGPASEALATKLEPATRSSVYPEPDAPLAYPTVAAPSPANDKAGEPDEITIAAIAEPEAEAADEAQAPEEPAAEADAELGQVSDVPLPKAKPEPPVKVRTAAKEAPKPQAQAATPEPSGSGPVQIIPTDVAAGQAPAQALAARQPQAQEAPRRRTVGREYDPLYGSRSTYSGSSSAEWGQAARPAPAQQVASIAPDARTSAAQFDGGYIVQLASFRSEFEALSEYKRLSQRHPQLVGNLDSRVQEASLGQSGAFYRLGIGPLPDRNAAAKLCNDLIAAGEKDCLVRRQ